MAAIPRASTGFSLIELVVVIAVLAVVAAGSVRFLHYAIEGYGLAGSRAELANAASTATARMAIELEAALPNSVRVSGGCIEFVPVDAVTQYLTLPRATAASSLQMAAPDASSSALAAARLAVDPSDPDKVYDSTAGYVSSVATFSVPDGAGVVTATFAAPLTFASEAPQQRIYVIGQPVSFCVDGTRLFRYSAYGLSPSQLLPAGLPATAPNRQPIADGIAPGNAPFSVLAPSLARNNIVAIALQLRNNQDVIGLQQSVHMRYVP